MKLALILIMLLFSSQVNALPCPNGSGVLYKGDLLEDVIKKCGEPLSQATNTRTLYTLQEWTYFIGHTYDEGYSKMVVSFKDERVIRIHIDDYFWTTICRRVLIRYGAATTVQDGCINNYDVAFTNLCGLNFELQANSNTVKYICGQPELQTKNEFTITLTELVYGKDVQQTIVFQNGKLLDWK